MGIFNLFGQKNKDEYKFLDSKEKACFSCSHVVNDNDPILYVSHDNEGDWQFLCGKEDHTEKNAKIISLYQAVQLDNSLNDLFEMPLGVAAERKTIEDTWTPFKLNE